MIFREVGDIDGIEVLNQYVLVAIYVRPEGKTAGGILLPEDAEASYQSKVGLVLKVGARAFVDDPDNHVMFHGVAAKPGDWVVYRASDGSKCQIGGRECRIIADVHIRMKLRTPDDVY